MKTLPLCICSVVLAVAAMAQPAPPPPPPPGPAASASATVSVSPAQDLADRIHQRIEKKLKGHHGIVINGDKDEDVDLKNVGDLGERLAIPIVGIVFMSIFGAPVLIVAVILYFGFSKSECSTAPFECWPRRANRFRQRCSRRRRQPSVNARTCVAVSF